MIPREAPPFPIRLSILSPRDELPTVSLLLQSPIASRGKVFWANKSHPQHQIWTRESGIRTMMMLTQKPWKIPGLHPYPIPTPQPLPPFQTNRQKLTKKGANKWMGSPKESKCLREDCSSQMDKNIDSSCFEVLLLLNQWGNYYHCRRQISNRHYTTAGFNKTGLFYGQWEAIFNLLFKESL